MRALKGMLLGLLLITLAVLPWPTGELSAAVADHTSHLRSLALNNVDVLLFSTVTFAMIEPALMLLVGEVLLIPVFILGLCIQILRLLWVLRGLVWCLSRQWFRYLRARWSIHGLRRQRQVGYVLMLLSAVFHYVPWRRWSRPPRTGSAADCIGG
jgi:hypothetical protein